MSQFIRNQNGEAGVDLNRNYGYKFGFDNEGSVNDPCDEIYRGAGPFSEFETQAVKNLVETSGRVSSAMNFHAWGNLWITPFCYSKDPNYETLMDPFVYKFYREFEDKIRVMGYNKSGNAQETIKYTANGEASDWMLGEHGIIALSPELGDDLLSDDAFFPSKDAILRVLKFQYPVVDLFLQNNRAIISEVTFGFLKTQLNSLNNEIHDEHLQENHASMFSISFLNAGILDVHDVKIVLNFFEDDVLNLIEKIEIDDGKQRLCQKWNVNKGFKEVTPLFHFSILKLSRTQIILWLKEERHFEFSLRIFKNGKELVRLSNIDVNSFMDFLSQIKRSLFSTVVIAFWALGFLALFLVAVYLICESRKKRQKLHVMEMIGHQTIDI